MSTSKHATLEKRFLTPTRLRTISRVSRLSIR